MIKICIVGASGRMGQEIMKAVSKDDAVSIVGLVDRVKVDKCPVSGLEIVDDILSAGVDCDVIIDFSGADGTCANIEKYRKLKKPLVVGSTGLNAQDNAKLYSLGADIPLLTATNMSVGVNLITKLAELSAAILGKDFDTEIFEAHHRYKKDAPSGTALTLGKAVAKGLGVDFDKAAVYDRQGITGERTPNTIGFQVLRGGDIAGEHTVFFCGDGERIEITHRASNREPFAYGALKAAKWLAGKPAGLYSIKDVLGF